MGWIGRSEQLAYYLGVVGADRDPETGAYLIRGTPPAFGLGGDEVVVPEDTEYRVGGERWCNLAAGIGGTSYGLSVRVIA